MALAGDDAVYRRRLHRSLAMYVVGVCAVLLFSAWAEYRGVSRHWLGPFFLFFPVMMYAAIGIYGRTSETEEYYVAGRRIPGFYNGMASAADWISAASFISLAGGLYAQGFSGSAQQPGGLAYVMGWTGGFCLLGLLIAPYLRQLRLYTVPDYFAVRFGGRWPRLIAALATVLCSFTYVVAQIYGIGLIAARLTGVQFEIGILLGLGGVLLCSFLGGMRAITWTQVAQYVVMLLAFLIPVSWLAYKQLGSPLAPLVYGQQLPKIEEFEKALVASPQELEVRREFLRRAAQYDARLADVEHALQRERAAAQARIRELKANNADSSRVVAAYKEFAAIPKDAEGAREAWTRARQEMLERARPLGGLPPHSTPYAGDRQAGDADGSSGLRLNFLALMFCLMVGTAGLPHLLTRFYTTPNVAEARLSVGWALFFIVLVYLSIPALPVLVKFEVLQGLVGSSIEALPTWIVQWAKVDPSLIDVRDINGDGKVQFGEIRIGSDIIMLATPEIGGLPYVVSGLVAAGGLAAALSTADGLLLTISNALVHDLYSESYGKQLTPDQRVILSKFALLVVGLIAAFVALMRSTDILPLVSASFSLAAAAFFPAMVLGIFWRKANRSGAVLGMLAGLAVTLYYMLANSAAVRAALGLESTPSLWFGIVPMSAGVFGVAAGFLVTIVASLLTQQADPTVRNGGPVRPAGYARRRITVTIVLLTLWFVATFVVAYFARSLQFDFFGWPFSFWMGAQGALLLYAVITFAYALYMNRLDRRYGVADDGEVKEG